MSDSIKMLYIHLLKHKWYVHEYFTHGYDARCAEGSIHICLLKWDSDYRGRCITITPMETD